MSRSILLWTLIGSFLVLALTLPAAAAESKVEKMTSDESQASYKRKSITYMGMSVDRGVKATDAQLATLEKALRKRLEIARYDYNTVDAGQFGSMKQFVQALRDYVGKAAHDRAAAEAEYEERFKRARVLATDIDRIMDSVYLYEIHVIQLKAKRNMKCPTGLIAIAEQGLKSEIAEETGQDIKMCAPGESVVRGVVAVEVRFYKANLTAKSGPAYKLLRRFRESSASKFDAGSYYGNKAAEVAITVASYLQAWQLQVQIKSFAPFRMFTPITGVVGDEVEFHAGKSDAIRIDDTYGIIEYDQAGAPVEIGWAKVRKVGDADGKGGGNPSVAEVITTKGKLAGGEQLFEKPMLNLGVELFGSATYAFTHVLNEDESGFYYGGGLMVNWDLGPKLGIPDFYLLVGGDYMVIDSGVGMVHAGLGIKKKWYLGPLGLGIGLRAGIAYMMGAEDAAGDTITAFGAGGDLIVAFEYYITPHWHAFLHVVPRFYQLFGFDEAGTVPRELGVGGNLGIMAMF